MLTLADATERVERGALFLDRVAPGWIDQIDPSALQLSDSCLCVLGQIKGSFWAAAEHYWGRTHLMADQWGASEEAVRCGFVLTPEDHPDRHTVRPAYAVLQDAWIELIADRKCFATPPTRILQETV